MGKLLLVIGNGFDKHCGLKSSFTDFFKVIMRRKKVKEFATHLKNNSETYNQFLTYFDDPNNTAFLSRINTWIMYFLIKSKIRTMDNWADVEKQLYDSLDSNKSKVLSFWDKVENSIDSITESDLKDSKLRPDEVKMLAIFIKKFKLNQFNTKKMHRFLFVELNRFELDFSKYLFSELRKNKVYIDKAYELYNELISNERHDQINLLSFNYLLPKDKIHSIFHKYENVHGTLDIKRSNVIIGIDSSEIDNKKKFYIFTKTSRKLHAFTQNNLKNINNVIDHNTGKIIFYGHSLNFQDYAYFQSIFDKLNLYSGNVELEFCYSIYNKLQREKISLEYTSAVINLIEKYGKSNNNNVQGKNLLHKLILESRIRIKEIPYDIFFNIN